VEVFKSLLLVGYILITIGCNSQCLESVNSKEGIKLSKTFELDSLIINSKSVNILLDHSLSFIDSLKFDHSETWLYYVIVLNSHMLTNDSLKIRVELNQGTDYDPFFVRIPDEGEKFSGAFCYKGTTFFVLCDNDSAKEVYDRFFKSHGKRNFNIYYNKPYVSQKWKDLGYKETRYLEYNMYIFYLYEDGAFKFIEMNNN
jgi:hypothetical protein